MNKSDYHRRAAHLILPLAAILFLCGCWSMKPHYLAQPVRVPVQGDYVHHRSGIKMPESVAGFQRNMVVRYDKAGLDVSAGYNLTNAYNTIVATVYVYPAPSLESFGSPPDVIAEARQRLTESEFTRQKQALVRAYSGVRMIDERDIVRAEAGKRYPGKFALFEYKEGPSGARVQVRSSLYLFCFVGGKWAVEYRFTIPEGGNAHGEVQDFIQKWNWNVK